MKNILTSVLAMMITILSFIGATTLTGSIVTGGIIMVLLMIATYLV